MRLQRGIQKMSSFKSKLLLDIREKYYSENDMQVIFFKDKRRQGNRDFVPTSIMFGVSVNINYEILGVVFRTYRIVNTILDTTKEAILGNHD